MQVPCGRAVTTEPQELGPAGWTRRQSPPIVRLSYLLASGWGLQGQRPLDEGHLSHCELGHPDPQALLSPSLKGAADIVKWPCSPWV